MQHPVKFEAFTADGEHKEAHPPKNDLIDREASYPQKIADDPGECAKGHGDGVNVRLAFDHDAKDGERAETAEGEENAAEGGREESTEPTKCGEDGDEEHPFLTDGDGAFERNEHAEKA